VPRTGKATQWGILRSASEYQTVEIDLGGGFFLFGPRGVAENILFDAAPVPSSCRTFQILVIYQRL
jgi:hypothetical protein